MKIRQEIIDVMIGKKVGLCKETIYKEKRWTNSPLNNTMVLKGKGKPTKCYKCSWDNTNWCWNCEQPHCDKHARAVLFPLITSFFINTLCLECSREFVKLSKNPEWVKELID